MVIKNINSKSKRSTRELLLDAAQEMIQTRGYTAMSFQAIAEKIGIKKPSIIHHFASKTALGEAVIDRYHLYFKNTLEEILKDSTKNSWDALEFYFSPYLEFAGAKSKICLCGALAGELMALPLEMQKLVKRFYLYHQQWLEAILEKGKASGEFNFVLSPKQLSRTFLSALQGALMLKRATGLRDQLNDVIKTIKAQLERK